MANISEILVSISITKDGDSFCVDLGSKISRKDYLTVKKLFAFFGGKWDGAKKTHVFAYDPTERLSEVQKSGILPDINPFAFFPTPVEDCIRFIDNDMFSFFKYLASIRKNDLKILEPSAGSGNFLDAIKTVFEIDDMDYYNHIVDAFDVDIENIRTLREKGYNPTHADFLQYNTDYSIKYDMIVMNPPFSVEGDKKAYITHIEHAHKMLKPGGEMLFIAPIGYRKNKDKRSVAFRDMLSKYFSSGYELSSETFRESGTKVVTDVVYLRGEQVYGKSAYNGFSNFFLWRTTVYAQYDERFYSDYNRLIEKGETDRNVLRSFILNIHSHAANEFVFLHSSEVMLNLITI
jgi:predicted RNA methylase